MDDLFTKYGSEGLFVILAAIAAYYFIRARAKTAEAAAAEKSADAIAVAAVSNAATKLTEHLLASLATTTESLRATTESVRATTATLAEMLTLLKASVASGAAIGSQMEVNTAAQATAAAASTLANTAIDASQTEILADIKTLMADLDLLTRAIEAKDNVDDKKRADMLERISRLEEFLTLKEEKEKQNEIPE